MSSVLVSSVLVSSASARHVSAPRVLLGAAAIAALLVAPAAAASAEPVAGTTAVYQQPARVLGLADRAGEPGGIAPTLQEFPLVVAADPSDAAGVAVLSSGTAAEPCLSPGTTLEVSWSNVDTGERGTVDVAACAPSGDPASVAVETGAGTINFSSRVLGPEPAELGSAGSVGGGVPFPYLSGNGSFTVA